MIVRKQTTNQITRYLKVFKPWAGRESPAMPDDNTLEARPVKGFHCTWTEDITAAMQIPDDTTLEALGLKNSEGNHFDFLTP